MKYVENASAKANQALGVLEEVLQVLCQKKKKKNLAYKIFVRPVREYAKIVRNSTVTNLHS